MVITDRFVFVHEPKTGGTFVRDVLGDLYRRKPPRSLLSRILRRRTTNRMLYEVVDKYHGTCHDIPESERSKPILSIVRNPFDMYVSFFYFGWWYTHPENSYDDVGLVKQQYSSFPNLSFPEFVMLANTRFDDFKLIGHNDIPHSDRPGWYTTRFVRYYFKNPTDIYPLIDSNFIKGQHYRDEMFDVHFMRTNRLNQDLYSYLGRVGFAAEEIDFVLDLERVKPAEQAMTRPDYDFMKYYTSELTEYILEKEKLLFSLFPDLLPQG